MTWMISACLTAVTEEVYFTKGMASRVNCSALPHRIPLLKLQHLGSTTISVSSGVSAEPRVRIG